MEKALSLHSHGLNCVEISRIIPVSDETIRRWCIKFAASESNDGRAMKKKVNQSHPQTPSRSQVESDEILSLQSEVKRLRAELTRSEIRAEAYEELIRVAESKFGIEIRKKAGAKQ